jgi:hypothetical protein
MVHSGGEGKATKWTYRERFSTPWSVILSELHTASVNILYHFYYLTLSGYASINEIDAIISDKLFSESLTDHSKFKEG